MNCSVCGEEQAKQDNMCLCCYQRKCHHDNCTNVLSVEEFEKILGGTMPTCDEHKCWCAECWRYTSLCDKCEENYYCKNIGYVRRT